MEILNTKYSSKKGVESTYYLGTLLDNNQRLLPSDDYFAIANELEIYTAEREKCNNYRLIVTLNPICTNVLCNRVTEVVYKEGSDDCTLLNKNGGIDSIKDKNQLPLYYKNLTDFKVKSNGIDGSVVFTRDTQLSRFDDISYKCGYDICNNHIIRNQSFKCVCQRTGNDNNFNTIFDFMRSHAGAQVKAYSTSNNGTFPMHLYFAEDLQSFEESLDANLIDENGWIGFVNKGNILTYKTTDKGDKEVMAINRVINNKTNCTFIDLSPDRTLFYFSPKFNAYRGRFEHNWRYCLTYPSSSTTKNISFIREKSNSLKIYYIDDSASIRGLKLCKIVSFCKHGLEPNDMVNLYINGTDTQDNDDTVIQGLPVMKVDDDYTFYVKYSDLNWINNSNFVTWRNEEEFEKYYSKLYIVTKKENSKINEDWYFTSISYDEVSGITHDIATQHIGSGSTEAQQNTFIEQNISITTQEYVWNSNDRRIVMDKNNPKNTFVVYNSNGIYKCNLSPQSNDLSYKQVLNNEEVQYYVRIFSKIPNRKLAETELTDYMTLVEREAWLKTYSNRKYDFSYQVSKLAFAKNVYGDEVSQIVFTDDIQVDGLKDNLGRDISDIYLTLIKNNAGYRDWYGKKGKTVKTNNENMEYSHVFGKLSCAFELSPETIGHSQHQNVTQNTNVDSRYQFQGLNISELNSNRPKEIENDEIEYNVVDDYDGDTVFYGDLCLFSPATVAESVIDDIWFRFNTAQRELSRTDTMYTNLSTVTYDEVISDDYDVNGFKGKTEYIQNASVAAAGYKYKPHYRIQLKTIGYNLNVVEPLILGLKKVTVSQRADGIYEYTITTDKENYLEPNGTFTIYNANREEYYTCSVVRLIPESTVKVVCTIVNEEDATKNVFMFDDWTNYKVVKRQDTIDASAVMLKDGTCRYAWRDVIQNGFDKYSRIEEYPFTNNALYIEKNLRIFVRRQDPDELLERVITSRSPLRDFEPSKQPEIEVDEYVNEEDIICE